MADDLQEDIELLKCMYVEDKEIFEDILSGNKTKIRFNLSEILNTRDSNEILNTRDSNETTREVFMLVEIDCGAIRAVHLECGASARSMLEEIGSERALLVSDVLEYVVSRWQDLGELLGVTKAVEEDAMAEGASILTDEVKDGEGIVEEKVQVVYQLDHIRNLGRYQKHLSRFSEEAGCCSLLYVEHRMIRVLVEGDPGAVRKFIKLHKTVNVDVDSRGKPCKERYIKILSEARTTVPLLVEPFTLAEKGSLGQDLLDILK